VKSVLTGSAPFDKAAGIEDSVGVEAQLDPRKRRKHEPGKRIELCRRKAERGDGHEIAVLHPKRVGINIRNDADVSEGVLVLQAEGMTQLMHAPKGERVSQTIQIGGGSWVPKTLGLVQFGAVVTHCEFSIAVRSESDRERLAELVRDIHSA
jgi:hypothetical protein